MKNTIMHLVLCLFLIQSPSCFADSLDCSSRKDQKSCNADEFCYWIKSWGIRKKSECKPFLAADCANLPIEECEQNASCKVHKEMIDIGKYEKMCVPNARKCDNIKNKNACSQDPNCQWSILGKCMANQGNCKNLHTEEQCLSNESCAWKIANALGAKRNICVKYDNCNKKAEKCKTSVDLRY
ncbi:MAG: hypothetical protein K2W94_02750 [Alphaproteobacteria bacterium]|nr:hypothetical protein [Alphaproteobacteria bacterium]